MDKKYHNQLIKIVGRNVLAYSKLLQQGIKETFIPPTEEEVITEYRHNTLFKRVIDNTVFDILYKISDEKE